MNACRYTVPHDRKLRTAVRGTGGGEGQGGEGAQCHHDYGILALTLWASHGKDEAETLWCPAVSIYENGWGGRDIRRASQNKDLHTREKFHN